MAPSSEDLPIARLRRSCLLVPGGSPGMLANAPRLPADEICLDLEDTVAAGAKGAARDSVIETLRSTDYGDRTVSVRINAVQSALAHRDIVDVVEAAGEFLDCVVLPKVGAPGDVEFIDHLLRMIEDAQEFEHRIGIEAQIGTSAGLTMVDEIAFASDRLEALVVAPVDLAASLGMPLSEAADMSLGGGWDAVLLRVLVAARTAGLQAIDGPYPHIRDDQGYRRRARQAQRLGFDGKWAVHPGQIGPAIEVFTPSGDEIRAAEEHVRAYREAAGARAEGAVPFGDVLVDDALRRLAEVTVLRGRATGAATQVDR